MYEIRICFETQSGLIYLKAYNDSEIDRIIDLT
jgi:hypothetical protein